MASTGGMETEGGSETAAPASESGSGESGPPPATDSADDGGPDGGMCCMAQDGPGCGGGAVEECVCK